MENSKNKTIVSKGIEGDAINYTPLSLYTRGDSKSTSH